MRDLGDARRLVRGYRYADFTPGRSFDHAMRRTIDRSESLLFSATTLSLCPLYFDAEAARADGHPDVVVNPYLVLALVVGLSVEDLSEHSEAFLGISEAHFSRDVYPGDTIRAESVVESRRESSSRPGFGIVAWRTTGLNQREEVLPVANRLDPLREDVPDSLLARLAELGYFGIMIDREHGGLGLGVLEYCLAAEELSCAWMSVASVIALANGALGPIDGERRDERLRRMARGKYLVAFALTEPQAGSDAANVVCAALRDGDDWIIEGRKRWCGWAKQAEAIMLFARTSEPTDPRRRHHGISMFLIEKERGTFPAGLEGQPIPKIGYHGITSWDLTFTGLRLPADALIGEEGRAFSYGMEEVTKGRVHTAARSIGAARGAFDEATAYAARRWAFEQPIGEFQALRFALADMQTEIAAAQALNDTVARAWDRGEYAIAEASMTKLFASQMAERVTSEAMQILGGNGYTTEYPVERHWRDARLTRIFEGTSEIQRRIISDSLLGRA